MYSFQWKKAILTALCVGFALTLLWGICSLQRQEALASRVIRLHVIGASDSAADQAVKLRVRDAVLDRAAPCLAGAATQAEAETILRENLQMLEAAAAETARQNGFSYGAKAILNQETYPTRDYGTFALPQGEYLSLRIVLGEGAGHNWWCVVFPPLCTAGTVAELGELSSEETALITRKNKTYELRFKSVELWQALVHPQD